MEKYLAKLEAQTRSSDWPGATPPEELWTLARLLIKTAAKEVRGTVAPHVAAHVDGVVLLLWGGCKSSVKVELNKDGVCWEISATDDSVHQTGSSAVATDVIDVLKLVFEEPRHSLVPPSLEKPV
jgi:hypothetical protein